MIFCTDRTYEDVLEKNTKGLYGYGDLNRVEGHVSSICSLAKSLDITLQLTVKTDWGLPGDFSGGSWPVKAQMQRYLSNIRAICDALELQEELPESMENLDYIGANKLENALKMAYYKIKRVTDAFTFSGEVFAGEENGI